MRGFFSKIISPLILATWVCYFSQAATNTVTSEIRYESGDVWVEDTAPERGGFKTGNPETPKQEFPKTKYSIDGSFDDWQDYKVGWSGNAPSQPQVVVGGRTVVRGDEAAQSRVVVDDLPSEGFFHVTECCYANDNDYFYVFLKFEPSVQRRYETLGLEGKVGAIGNIGSLYVDSDSDEGTGAQRPAVKPQFVGVDLMIFVTAEANVAALSKRSSAGVSYHISNWNASSREFGVAAWRQSSNSSTPRINHGKDGVEIAIPLADIRKAKSDKFVLVFQDDIPFSPARRVSVKIE